MAFFDDNDKHITRTTIVVILCSRKPFSQHGVRNYTAQVMPTPILEMMYSLY